MKLFETHKATSALARALSAADLLQRADVLRPGGLQGDRQSRPADRRGRPRLHPGVAGVPHHGADVMHRPRLLLNHPLLVSLAPHLSRRQSSSERMLLRASVVLLGARAFRGLTERGLLRLIGPQILVRGSDVTAPWNGPDATLLQLVSADALVRFDHLDFCFSA